LAKGRECGYFIWGFLFLPFIFAWSAEGLTWVHELHW